MNRYLGQVVMGKMHDGTYKLGQIIRQTNNLSGPHYTVYWFGIGAKASYSYTDLERGLARIEEYMETVYVKPI